MLSAIRSRPVESAGAGSCWRIASRAPANRGHRPFRKHVVARQFVEEETVGVDGSALRLAYTPRRGPTDSGVRALGGLAARFDEVAQRKRPYLPFHGLQHRVQMIRRALPVVVVEIGHVAAVRGIAQNGLERASELGVEATMSLRGRVAGRSASPPHARAFGEQGFGDGGFAIPTVDSDQNLDARPAKRWPKIDRIACDSDERTTVAVTIATSNGFGYRHSCGCRVQLQDGPRDQSGSTTAHCHYASREAPVYEVRPRSPPVGRAHSSLSCLRITLVSRPFHTATSKKRIHAHAARGFPANQGAARHRGQHGQRPGDESRGLSRRDHQARVRRNARGAERRAAHPQQGQRDAQRDNRCQVPSSTSRSPALAPISLLPDFRSTLTMSGAKFDTLVGVAFSGRLPTKFFVDAGERGFPHRSPRYWLRNTLRASASRSGTTRRTAC